MNKEVVLGWVRHGLTYVGGVLTGTGVIRAEASEIELVVGAVITLAGFIWSKIAKG